MSAGNAPAAGESLANCHSDRYATQLIARLVARGISLWVSAGELRYCAPYGTLHKSDIESMRKWKHSIMSALSASADIMAPSDEARNGIYRAPATFSQLAYWNQFGLEMRDSPLIIRSITRFRGQLDVSALQRSLSAVVNRHDALKSRMLDMNGTLVQEVDTEHRAAIEVLDWRSFSEDDRQRSIEHLMRDGPTMRVTERPLYLAQLAMLGGGDYVLAISMEHIISDGRSMSIFMEELLQAYVQTAQELPVCLPECGIQFPEYAARQRRQAYIWTAQVERYFREHFAGCGRVRLPSAGVAPLNSNPGTGLTYFEVDRRLRCALVSWCKARRTTPALAAFTAFAALLFSWCKVSEIVIPFQIDGRLEPEVANSIGYFAFKLYLRIWKKPNDTFGDLLRRVMEEYCLAHEHLEYSYIEARDRREFMKNPCFNWIPKKGGGDSRSTRSLTERLVFWRDDPRVKSITSLDRDAEPALALVETADVITGCIGFPANRFSHGDMEDFGRRYLGVLAEMIVA